MTRHGLRWLRGARRTLFDIRLQPLRKIEMYGSHGIQQEGRLFEIGEETGIESGERGEGKIGKNQSWKYAFECQNCGKRCAGRKDAANRFCQQSCQAEFDVKRWLACSCCLAKIGLGSHAAGKLLNLSNSSVGRQWKARGIKADKPRCGSMVRVGRSIITAKRKEAEAVESEPQRLYEEAAMADIRAHRAFPDWSSVWRNEKYRAKCLAAYHALPPEIRKLRNQNWKFRNKDGRVKALKKWKANNPEKVKAAISRWKEKTRHDPKHKVKRNLRCRFKEIMESARMGGTSGMWTLIGCSSAQLASHLQSKFKRGMTWANYGSHWHVDHVLPCASFDQQDPKQRAQCWHWTNLEPLEAKRNLAKSSSITKPQMQLLLTAH